MTEPVHSSSGISHGSTEMLRACIGETVAGAAIHADLATTYAEICDDVGLGYAIRCLVADVRAAVSLLADLREHKARVATRETERRGPRTAEGANV
ncbi:hypothetical protein [Methylobacterium sp. WSM2598]|uniref:hypothetical protein n=1 Tax=Methylobacterium sp. WSM2598 TaxID=398261 RepID=UPI00036A70BD|nr:hypothetical protein [Methylobacterium sp. WSM2598]